VAVDRKKILSGGNAAIAVLAVLGVLVLLNAISDRRFKRWDWTGSQIYSLSDKTVKILTGLKTDVAATVLLQPDDPVYDEIHELLANYQSRSPHIKVEYLDPSRQPARVEEIIKTFGLGRGDRTAIVFSSGARHRHITIEELVELDMSMAEMGMGNPRVKAFKGEAAFTSAILSVSQETQRNVVFLKGHGEVEIDDGAAGGISRFAETLIAISPPCAPVTTSLSHDHEKPTPAAVERRSHPGGGGARRQYCSGAGAASLAEICQSASSARSCDG